MFALPKTLISAGPEDCGRGAKAVYLKIRERVVTLREDRAMSGDIEKVVTMISDGSILEAVEKVIKPLH